MSLRNQISMSAAVLMIVPAVLVIAGGISGALLGPAMGLAAIWVIFAGPLIWHVILPAFYPQTTCPGCRRIVPLIGRWRCGSHYTDHRERHILAFRCQQGHVLEGFNCPRCRATILVRHGDRKFLRHGTAERLRSTASFLPESSRDLLIGHDHHNRPVAMTQRMLDWHVAITGGTGRGKSTLLANIAQQLCANGTGFTLLDPGGDLAQLVLSLVPAERQQDVLFLDVANVNRQFPLNVLSAHDPLEQAVLTEELLGVFERLYGGSWGPMLAHQLRMGLKAAMAAGGTLRDVYGLFVDAATRRCIIQRIDDPALRAFWTDEFPAIPAVRRSAVINKLAPIVFHPILGPIVCAQDCVLDADVAVARRRIVLVNLASGTPADDITTLLGTFIVQKIVAAAFRQGRRPPEQRTRHVLIVDEFQRFMHRAAGFDQILAEARKYRLSLIVANQFVEQLSDTVRAALFGNVGGLVAFRVGHRDARILAPEFIGSVPEELLELEIGQALVRIGTDWTFARTLPPPSPPVDRVLVRITNTARATAPNPVQVVERREEPPNRPEERSEFVQ